MFIKSHPLLVLSILITFVAAFPSYAADIVADQIISPVSDDQWYSWAGDYDLAGSWDEAGESVLWESEELLAYDFSALGPGGIGSGLPISTGSWGGSGRGMGKLGFAGMPLSAAVVSFVFNGLGNGALGGLKGSAATGAEGSGITQIHSGTTATNIDPSSPSFGQSETQEYDWTADSTDNAAPVTDSSSLILFGTTALPFVISRFRSRR